MMKLSRRHVLKGVGTTGLALTGAASYYGVKGTLANSDESSGTEQSTDTPSMPAGGPTQADFRAQKTRATTGLPTGEVVVDHSFGRSFKQFYTDGDLYIGVSDDEVRFGSVENPADHKTGTISAGTIKRSGLFRGSPIFHIKNGIFRFDTETESLSLLISEVGDTAAIAITDSALVVADERTIWVKDGDSDPRELAAESVIGGATIIPNSLCIDENGRIYIADTSGVIWQTPIEAFVTPANISVQSVAETSPVTALIVVDGQLVYASPAEVGVISVEPTETYTAVVSSPATRPATNGTDIITGHEQTVTHLRFDSNLRTAAAYEVTAPIEHVQLAGRNAVVTTTTGTTVIDLATGSKTTRGGQIRYIGPHYMIADRDGETQLRINVQR